MDFIDHLNWRYATKKFDATKKVSAADLENLKEAIRLSPTSYGLQAHKILLVEDTATRAKLREVSWGQSQVTDASHLFVFCSYQDLTPAHVDELFELKAKAFGKEKSDFEQYISFINGKVAEKTKAERAEWNARQTYIAMSNLLDACAALKIDACPMEGFDAKAVGEILDLDSKGLDATVLVTVGYRSSEDATQNYPKVRKPMSDLFETI